MISHKAISAYCKRTGLDEAHAQIDLQNPQLLMKAESWALADDIMGPIRKGAERGKTPDPLQRTGKGANQ